MSHHRRVKMLVSILFIAALLALPGMASAGSFSVAHAKQFLAPGEGTVLVAGPVTLTVPEGALPDGGLVGMHVKWEQGGWLELNLVPEQSFPVPITLSFSEFGDAAIYYLNHGEPELIEVIDGSYSTDHFSRYSGWY